MEKKIGKNVSSGAKKVERVEEEKKDLRASASGTPEQKTTKKTSRKTGEKSPSTRKSEEKSRVEKAVKKENAAAEKRLNAAKARAEKKEKKLLKRAQVKQAKIEKRAELKKKKLERKELIARKRAERKQSKIDRRAAIKEKRAERRAEKIARRELLKNESKTERQKRIAREKRDRIALKRQRRESRDKARENRLKAREAARARKAENKKHKREQKTERKKNSRGIGGWLAAVISLGVACLALATVVTAGGFRMNEMNTTAENGYRSTLYEMVSVSEDLDDNLSKLRVSSGSNEQRKLLTNVLVDSALLESALERIPVDAATSTDISAFVNKTGSYARTLLAKLAAGKSLTETEKNTISYLYGVNDKIYRELNDLTLNMTVGDLREFMKGGEGSLSQKFGEVGQTSKEEPEEIVDAPFYGEGNVGENKLALLDEVTESRAEELARSYFNAYHVKNVKFTGETLSQEIACYNFVLTDENDVEIYAQITKNGGKLAFFDTYEVCTEKNFELQTCDKLAKEFLATLGIDDVEAVWLTDSGMVADITYVKNVNGVRAYPDMVRVRVCESKGKVVGMEASGYLLNQDDRTAGASLSEAEAREKLSSAVEANEGVLCVIPVDGEEVLAYEFLCHYGEDQFVIYLDAHTGDEVQVFLVRESAHGSYLR